MENKYLISTEQVETSSFFNDVNAPKTYDQMIEHLREYPDCGLDQAKNSNQNPNVALRNYCGLCNQQFFNTDEKINPKNTRTNFKHLLHHLKNECPRKQLQCHQCKHLYLKDEHHCEECCLKKLQRKVKSRDKMMAELKYEI